MWNMCECVPVGRNYFIKQVEEPVFKMNSLKVKLI